MLNYLKKRNNSIFYLTAASQVLVAIQLVFAVFGYDSLLDAVMQNKILAAVDAVLIVLGTFGVVNNPTVPGVKDEQ